jgi:hypothetical protein
LETSLVVILIIVIIIIRRRRHHPRKVLEEQEEQMQQVMMMNNVSYYRYHAASLVRLLDEWTVASLRHARRILNILQATANDDDDNIIENASCMADIYQSIHYHPQHDEKTTKKHQLMLTLTYYLMSLVTLVGN